MILRVGCLINIVLLLIGFLGGSTPKVKFFGVVKKSLNLGFGVQVMIIWSLCVSGPYILQISCGTRSKLA